VQAGEATNRQLPSVPELHKKVTDLEAQLESKDGELAYFREHLSLADETERLLRAEVRSLTGADSTTLHKGPLWTKQNTNGGDAGGTTTNDTCSPPLSTTAQTGDNNSEDSKDRFKGPMSPVAKMASCIGCVSNSTPRRK